MFVSNNAVILIRFAYLRLYVIIFDSFCICLIIKKNTRYFAGNLKATFSIYHFMFVYVEGAVLHYQDVSQGAMLLQGSHWPII
jgi:hypothetical protein